MGGAAAAPAAPGAAHADGRGVAPQRGRPGQKSFRAAAAAFAQAHGVQVGCGRIAKAGIGPAHSVQVGQGCAAKAGAGQSCGVLDLSIKLEC